MKKLISLLALGLTLALGSTASVHAATGQQNKMKTCNVDAKSKELKGDARKSFMKECLSTKSGDAKADSAASPVCEKSAADKKLHGAAKKAHVKKCMADGAAPAPTAPAPTAAPASAVK
jgi:hypothetical protein